jgi:hypothetical protein
MADTPAKSAMRSCAGALALALAVPLLTVGVSDPASGAPAADPAAARTADATTPQSRARVRTSAAGGSCGRPYRATSPWNRPIGRRPAYDARSDWHVQGAFGDQRLSSDPTQYTYPVYSVSARTPRRAVPFSGYFSDVRRGGRHTFGKSSGSVRIPLPDHAREAEGSDGQIILVNRRTGEEWGVWQASRDGAQWRFVNGYHYNTRWSGVPPRGFGSRGAGVTYLAGLVRPCEIRRGRIDHALAFAYDYPTRNHVYPATKSDGSSSDPVDLPEGARLQLDPGLSRRELRGMGCRGACLTIARALQRYGMYVIDKSGRPKIMLEYEGTARWRGRLDQDTVKPLALSRFKLLRLP